MPTLANAPDWINQYWLPLLVWATITTATAAFFAIRGLLSHRRNCRRFTVQESTLLVDLYKKAGTADRLVKRGSGFQTASIYIGEVLYEGARYVAAFDSLNRDGYFTENEFARSGQAYALNGHLLTVKGVAAAESIIVQQQAAPMKVSGFRE